MTAAMATASSPPVVGTARRLAPVRIWLFAVAALVLAMVSLGGATRLTGSGLSITEWKPIIGMLPPLTEADWQEAFRKYQQIPQYEYANKGMSLAAFKVIFWWEWAHRNLGRLIGIAFAMPFLVFLARGWISRRLGLNLAGIFALGGLQGLVGWYMVSSGLSERIDVSHYRLALHLGLAVLILGALLWAALSLQDGEEASGQGSAASRAAAVGIAMGVFVQILLGALVAGLKAGQAYNTWPLMDGRIIPSGLGAIEPWYLNLFENAMTVQFNHRVVAYGLVVAVVWRAAVLFGSTARRGERRSAGCLALAVVMQLGLGIWTLLSHVPPALGVAHQAMAAIVFALAVWHCYESRFPWRSSRC
jgi:cytochrome c oxidase assembly protein subunit 15